MNPAPIVPTDICRIFLNWATTAQAIAESLHPCSELRSKIVDAVQAIVSLALLGGDIDRVNGALGTVPIGVILLDPTTTYTRIVFLADLLGQLPATAGTPCALESARAVNAWMRIQRSWCGTFATDQHG